MTRTSSFRVFISYKTRDSHASRLVADWLVHNQVDVWFAEQEIGLDGRSQSDVARALRRGVGASTHAIVFLNEWYAGSEWCRDHELRALLRDLPHRNILIVDFPRRPESLDRLYGIAIPADVPCISLSESAPVDIARLEAAMRHAGWPLPARMKGPVEIPVASSRPFSLPVLGLAWDLHDWQFKDGRQKRAAGFSSRDDYFLRDLEGPLQLCVTSTFYADISQLAPSHRGLLAIHAAGGSLPPLERLATPAYDNDVALYEYAVATAREYGDMLHAACGRAVSVTGVHLFFLGEQGQFAMSYDLHDPELGSLAARKYVVVIRDAREFGGVFELIFTFNTYGGQERLRALSPYLDYVVTCAVPSCEPPQEPADHGFDPLHERRRSTGSHPLLQPLLGSRMRGAARPIVLANPPPADVQGEEASPRGGTAATFALSLAISALLVGGLTAAVGGAVSGYLGRPVLGMEFFYGGLMMDSLAWTRTIALGCFAGAAICAAMHAIVGRRSGDRRLHRTLELLGMATVGAIVQGLLCGLVAIVAERVPTLFLLLFALGAIGPAVAGAFGVQECLPRRRGGGSSGSA